MFMRQGKGLGSPPTVPLDKCLELLSREVREGETLHQDADARAARWGLR
jgi:hypothetical protein